MNVNVQQKLCNRMVTKDISYQNGNCLLRRVDSGDTRNFMQGRRFGA
jgi:hypothetical protein